MLKNPDKPPLFPNWQDIEVAKNGSYGRSVWLGFVGVFFWAPSTLGSALAEPLKMLGAVLLGLVIQVFAVAAALVSWAWDKVLIIGYALAGRVSVKRVPRG